MLQYLLYNFHVFFALVLEVHEDVIEIYYHENVELFCQDLVDIALESGRCIGQSKRHDLILEVAIAGLESRFPFIVLPYLYLMAGIA